MRNMRHICAIVLAAALSNGSAGAAEVPKIAPASIQKVSAPADHQLRFGAVKRKYQSFPQTSAVCQTPVGWCYVPGWGNCYCCFPGYGCQGGWAS